MTSVTDSSAEAGDAEGVRRNEGDSAAKTYVVLSGVQLVIAALAGLLAATQLIEPGIVGSVKFLTFGRVQPVFLNALVFGWLSMALTGAVLFITPRLCGHSLVAGGLARANAILWFVLVVIGEGAIKLGFGGGQQLLEFPMVIAAGMALSAAISAGVVVATIVRRPEPNIYPSLWFFGASTLLLPLMIVAANLPIYAGIGQATQANFFVQNLFGLWLLSAALGVTYYFIPRITGNPLYSKRLALVGFWSLAIFWIFTGPVRMIYSPSLPGLQTMAIAFSITCAIPIWTALANFAGSMRGRWGVLSRSVPSRFLVAGCVFLFAYSILLPLGALRSTQQVVGLTDFLLGTTELFLFGAVGCIAAAGVYEVVPRATGRQWVSIKAANWHLGLTVLGVAAVTVGTKVGGTVQGFSWLSGATSAAPVVTGDGWSSVAAPMKWFYTLEFVGMLLVAIGAAVFLTNLVRTVVGGRLAAVEQITAGVAGDEVETEVVPADTMSRAVAPVAIPVLSIALIGLVTYYLSRVLLWANESSGKTSATVIALVVSTVIVVVAAIVAWRPALRGGAAIAILAVGIVAVTGAGAYANSKLSKAPPKHEAAKAESGGAAAGANSVDMTAKNIAFNTNEIKFKAGPARINFDNTDFAPHNVAIYKNSQLADTVFKGANVQAGDKTTYSFDLPSSGNLYFQCDLHPNMNGTVVVS